MHEIHYTRADGRFATQFCLDLAEAQALARQLIAQGRQVLAVKEAEPEVRFTPAPPLRPSSLAERLAA